MKKLLLISLFLCFLIGNCLAKRQFLLMTDIVNPHLSAHKVNPSQRNLAYFQLPKIRKTMWKHKHNNSFYYYISGKRSDQYYERKCNAIYCLPLNVIFKVKLIGTTVEFRWFHHATYSSTEPLLNAPTGKIIIEDITIGD